MLQNDARKTTLERLSLVNESLSQVAFNQVLTQKTFLRIEASGRYLPDVKAFKQLLQQALTYAWSEAPESAEARFLALQQTRQLCLSISLYGVAKKLSIQLACLLTGLNSVEQAVYQGLKEQRWQDHVRLEQERINWQYASDIIDSVVTYKDA